MRLKILILLDGLIKSDARVRRIALELATWHSVTVLSFGEEQDLQDSRISIVTLPPRRSRFRSIFDFSWPYWYDPKKILADSRFDVAIVNDYPLLRYAVHLKSKKIAKYLLYDSHEIYVETINQMFDRTKLTHVVLIEVLKRIHMHIENRLVQRVDRMLTVCDSLAKYFDKRFELNKNVSVLRNCSSVEFSLAERRELSDLDQRVQGKRIAIYHGVVNPGRGIEKLLEASLYLEDDVAIVILGMGTLFESLKTHAEARRNNKVIFIPSVPYADLASYLKSALLGLVLIEPINLSKRWSLPNKLFECMAAGIPVLTNELPEASAIVKRWKCGWVVNDDSPEDVARAINKYIRTGAISEEGINGQRAVLNDLNWEKEVQVMHEIINSLGA